MKNVVIDLDNTLNNLIEFLYYSALDKKSDIPHFSTWDSYFTLNKYFNEEEVENIINDAIIRHDTSFAKPLGGVSDLLNFFKKNNINVKITTLRDKSLAKMTEEWLEYHNLYYDMLIFAKDKRNHINKDTILFIDDAPHLVKRIKKHVDEKNYNTKCIMMSRHLYAKKSNIHGVYKAKNVKDIIDISKQICKAKNLACIL